MPRLPKTDRRRGRQRNALPVLVRLDADERARLERVAAEAGCTLSALMRNAVGRLTVVPQDDTARIVYLLTRLTGHSNQLALVANSFGPAAAVEVCAGLRRLEAWALTISAGALPPDQDWTA